MEELRRRLRQSEQLRAQQAQEKDGRIATLERELLALRRDGVLMEPCSLTIQSWSGRRQGD